MLSYNPNPSILELYKDYEIVYPEWRYGMSKDKSSKEILILNVGPNTYKQEYALVSNTNDDSWVHFVTDISESKMRLIASSSLENVSLTYSKTLI